MHRVEHVRLTTSAPRKVLVFLLPAKCKMQIKCCTATTVSPSWTGQTDKGKPALMYLLAAATAPLASTSDLCSIRLSSYFRRLLSYISHTPKKNTQGGILPTKSTPVLLAVIGIAKYYRSPRHEKNNPRQVKTVQENRCQLCIMPCHILSCKPILQGLGMWTHLSIC